MTTLIQYCFVLASFTATLLIPIALQELRKECPELATADYFPSKRPARHGSQFWVIAQLVGSALEIATKRVA